MELITTVATFVGYVALFFMVLAIVCYILAVAIEFKNNENYFCFKIFKFGILYTKNEDTAKRCNALTESNNKKLFIEAPLWFNKHVYNFGAKRTTNLKQHFQSLNR